MQDVLVYCLPEEVLPLRSLGIGFIVVVLVLVLMTVMNIRKIAYILEVVRFDEHLFQVCIFLVVARYDEEV